MMDGRVGAIRDALDQAGCSQTAILSYAAKFASAFYGPFREAAGSAPDKGDRKGYQADPRAGRAAVRDALLDEAEGADLLMVKPALAYLDVIAALRAATRLPLVCYNVSGEYSMIQLAAREGLLDLRAAVLETLLSMRRAGADRIITYHAREALAEGWLER
jgi:porphobilinogen synthase